MESPKKEKSAKPANSMKKHATNTYAWTKVLDEVARIRPKTILVTGESKHITQAKFAQLVIQRRSGDISILEDVPDCLETVFTCSESMLKEMPSFEGGIQMMICEDYDHDFLPDIKHIIQKYQPKSIIIKLVDIDNKDNPVYWVNKTIKLFTNSEYYLRSLEFARETGKHILIWNKQ